MQSYNPKVKILNFTVLFSILIFTLYFFGPQARAADCVATPPKVVNSGGKLWDKPERILVKDDRPLRLGDHDTQTAGWVTLDLGCFVDHRGADLRVYELGKAEGGEVRVGTNLAEAPAGWGHVPPICGHKESLPESSPTCPFADSWLELNIGRDNGAHYRYVYLSSAGSAIGEAAYGGSPDLDALEVMPPGWSVDLVPAKLASGTVAEYYASSLVPVVFKALIYGEPEGKITYRFACDGRTGEFQESSIDTRPPGSQEMRIKNLSCNYLYAGTFYPEILVRASGQEFGDRLTLYAGVGEPIPAVGTVDGRGLKLLLLGMAASVLAWAVYKLS